MPEHSSAADATDVPPGETDDPLEEPDEPHDASDEPHEAIRCYCRLGGLMDRLSSRYAIQVVCVVGALQPVRYGEIEAAFGDVSSSTLSTRLDELREAGLLEREQYDEIPPRVEYRLTDDGEELRALLEPLLEWVESRST